MPACDATRRNSTRTPAADQGRPRVGPSITQNSGPTGSFARSTSQGRSCSKPPLVHADLAPTTALAAADEDRATARIEVGFRKRQRLLDPKPAAPKDDDHGAEPSAVAISANLAHHGDDLLDRRRVGRVAQSFVAG